MKAPSNSPKGGENSYEMRILSSIILFFEYCFLNYELSFAAAALPFGGAGRGALEAELQLNGSMMGCDT